MSLIIRRVRNISRKKRKSRSRTRHYIRDAFEDDASKFTVIEDFYSENFPPLRPVYRKDIFGTPIVFRITNGIDFCGEIDFNVKINSITFMKEYKNKSFEELRWEDYTCGRKEVLHYEENGYLKSLSAKTVIKKINYEFFDPAPKNIPSALSKEKTFFSMFRTTNCSLDDLFSKKLQNLPENESISSIQSSKSFDEITDSERSSEKICIFAKDNSILDTQTLLKSFLPKIADEKLTVIKESRHRSILTYVDKISQPLIKKSSITKNLSDVCLTTRSEGNASKQESIEILRTNLVRYFETAEPTASMPYDFVTQNPKFYLPCAEIGFVYQNARPSLKIIEEPLIETLQANSHGLNAILEKLDPLFGKNTHKYLCYERIDKNEEKKYNLRNQFKGEYFWNKFHPYKRRSKIPRVSRAKYIVSGKGIID